MKAGTAVGVAGYPLEKIRGGEMQGTVATPNLRTGMVSSVTDMFFLPGDDAHRRLVTHNVAITGGNSGSPMVGSDGKLLALVNAGNIVASAEGGRTPSGAVINYAQRADLLRDLLEGRADAALEEDRKYWNTQTASFARGSEYLIPNIIEQLKARGVKPEVAAEFKGKLTKAEQFTGKDKDGKEVQRRQKIYSITGKANTGGIVIAYARNRTAVQLYLVVDGKIVLQDEREVFLPYMLYPNIEKDLTAEVYVVGGDTDADFDLVHYTWSRGQS